MSDNIEKSRFEDRLEFFKLFNKEFKKEHKNRFNKVQFPDDEDLIVICDLYFVMMNAYKKHRLKFGHNTQYPKVAAIKVLAIMALRPFRGMECDELFYSNPVFALDIASTTLELEFGLDALNENDLKRLYQWLDSIQFENTKKAINWLISKRQSNIAFNHCACPFDLTNQEMSNIGMLVSYFEMLDRYDQLTKDA